MTLYAITSSGYRAIASAADTVAGETAVGAIPVSLTAALLAACDWTQAADSPLDAAAKSAWASYRTALRNVPQQAGFPATIVWSTPP